MRGVGTEHPTLRPGRHHRVEDVGGMVQPNEVPGTPVEFAVELQRFTLRHAGTPRSAEVQEVGAVAEIVLPHGIAAPGAVAPDRLAPHGRAGSDETVEGRRGVRQRQTCQALDRGDRLEVNAGAAVEDPGQVGCPLGVVLFPVALDRTADELERDRDLVEQVARARGVEESALMVVR